VIKVVVLVVRIVLVLVVDTDVGTVSVLEHLGHSVTTEVTTMVLVSVTGLVIVEAPLVIVVSVTIQC
jgi:hypothetical protein